MWFRSGVAVAVAVAKASGYSSNLTPSLGTSICRGCSPRKGKKKKKKKQNSIKLMWEFPTLKPLLDKGR